MPPGRSNTPSAHSGARHRDDKPTVSIVLPTYNRTDLLRLSVASVFAQTFADWELIVSDDGSGEETKAYLRGLESSRLRVLHSAHSGNPSRVRNLALEAARGSYVAFLDSDDLWAPTKLQAQLTEIQSFDHFRWSYSACDRIDKAGNLLPPSMQIDVKPRSGWIFEPLLALETSVPMPTLIAERSLLEHINGFDEDLPYGEFHDLSLRLALASEVVGVKRILCSLRAHDHHYSADRMAAHGAWMRLYAKFHSIAPSPEARIRCERMRAQRAQSRCTSECPTRPLRRLAHTARRTGVVMAPP